MATCEDAGIVPIARVSPTPVASLNLTVELFPGTAAMRGEFKDNARHRLSLVTRVAISRALPRRRRRRRHHQPALVWRLLVPMAGATAAGVIARAGFPSSRSWAALTGRSPWRGRPSRKSTSTPGIRSHPASASSMTSRGRAAPCSKPLPYCPHRWDRLGSLHTDRDLRRPRTPAASNRRAKGGVLLFQSATCAAPRRSRELLERPASALGFWVVTVIPTAVLRSASAL
jgi:hypothetical protein